MSWIDTVGEAIIGDHYWSIRSSLDSKRFKGLIEKKRKTDCQHFDQDFGRLEQLAFRETEFVELAQLQSENSYHFDAIRNYRRAIRNQRARANYEGSPLLEVIGEEMKEVLQEESRNIEGRNLLLRFLDVYIENSGDYGQRNGRNVVARNSMERFDWTAPEVFPLGHRSDGTTYSRSYTTNEYYDSLMEGCIELLGCTDENEYKENIAFFFELAKFASQRGDKELATRFWIIAEDRHEIRKKENSVTVYTEENGPLTYLGEWTPKGFSPQDGSE